MLFAYDLLKILKRRFDDDLFDRLNYYYTSCALCFLAILVGGKQYFGQPIQCWIPSQFNYAWQQYTETYCYSHNTYYVSMDEEIPDSLDDRENRQIGYYQWVPLALVLKAAMFFLPIVVWRMLNWQSGIRTNQITNMAADPANINEEVRRQNVQTIARHLYTSKKFFRGNFINFLYLFTKILFIFNIVCQFFIVNTFLGRSLAGVEILRDLIQGDTPRPTGSSLFPRITLCDFKVRALGNVHDYTVQCILMINIFNEKIFLFLWWWYVLIGVVTCSNFIYRLLISVMPFVHRRYIKSFLNVNNVDESQLKKFVHQSLSPDTALLIRLISGNGGELFATKVVQELWRLFNEDDQQNESP